MKTDLTLLNNLGSVIFLILQSTNYDKSLLNSRLPGDQKNTQV